MASVGFAFGENVGVSEYDALELAQALEMTKSLAGRSAARKLRKQAGKWKERLEASQDVDFTAEELEVFARVLATDPWPKEQPWFDYLSAEVERARSEA